MGSYLCVRMDVIMDFSNPKIKDEVGFNDSIQIWFQLFAGAVIKLRGFAVDKKLNTISHVLSKYNAEFWILHYIYLYKYIYTIYMSYICYI